MRLVRVIVPDIKGSAHHHFKDLKETQVRHNEQIFEILRASVLLSDATIEKIEEGGRKIWKAFGNPTEKATVLAGEALGINKNEMEKEFPRVDILPFNSRSKYTAIISRTNTNENTLLHGRAGNNPLSLLRSPPRYEGLPVEQRRKQKFEKEFESLIQSGLRMTAIAIKDLSKDENQFEGRETNLMHNLTFIGFLAFRDPVRSQVKDAMQLCQAAGIRVIMITGDHRLTAKAIAGEVGLNVSDKEIIQGSELPEMSDEELRKRAQFSRSFRAHPADGQVAHCQCSESQWRSGGNDRRRRQ